jgi:hypothetical protein
LTKTPFSKYLKWSGFSLVKHEMGWRLNSSRVLLSNAQASRKSSPTCRGIWLLTVLQADADFREKRPCLSCTWERKVFGMASFDSSTSIVCHKTKGLGRRRTYRFEEVLRLLHSCLLAFPKPFQHCHDFFYRVFHLL